MHHITLIQENLGDRFKYDAFMQALEQTADYHYVYRTNLYVTNKVDVLSLIETAFRMLVYEAIERHIHDHFETYSDSSHPIHNEGYVPTISGMVERVAKQFNISFDNCDTTILCLSVKHHIALPVGGFGNHRGGGFSCIT